MAARPLVPLLLALTVPLSLAAAQGLGDAAARERARREKQMAGADRAGKSFSDDDLERGRPADTAGKKTRPASSPAPSEPAPPSYAQSETGSSEPDAPAPPRPPAEPEPDIPALEARIKLLQDKLNPMSGSYIFGPFGSGDPTEEPRTRDELQRLEAELAKAREAAARASVPMRQEESEPAPH